MKDSCSSLSSKFYLYESQKQNRQGENTRRIIPSHNNRKSTDHISYSTPQTLYIQKLEAKNEQLLQLLQSSQTQFKSLQDENSCLRKICQKQQQKLSQNKNTEMIREEFNKQIEEMNREKEKIADMMVNLSEEHSKEMVELTKYAQTIEIQLENSKGEAKAVEDKYMGKVRELETEIEGLKLEIDEKRNIEKKYKLVLRDLDRMQKRSLSQQR